MNLKMTSILLLFVFVFIFVNGCSEADKTESNRVIEKQNSKVIYGDDDRKDYYEVSDSALKKISESTVALIKNSDLKQLSNGKVQVLSQSYKTAYNLCSSEPFVNQQIAAFCSGSLVAKDIVITAGHCIKTQADCSQVKFAFGFSVLEANKLPQELLSEDIYGCKEIIKQELSSSNGMDYAIIRLDRVVQKQKPLKIKRNNLSINAPITVIGHPSGLPVKIASGGRIRSLNTVFYTTNLDTYGGNSGSAVFDSESLEVIGILVRGEEDYVRQGSCNASNRCAIDNCRGEDVTRIDHIANFIPENGDDENPPPPPSVVYEALANLPIPDRNTTGVTSTIDILELPQGRKVLIAIDIQHAYVGDLILTLIDSNGKSYVLRKNKGGRQANLSGVFGETLVSESDLSVLSQIQNLGKFKLKVSDTTARDIGVLKSWKLIYQ